MNKIGKVLVLILFILYCVKCQSKLTKKVECLEGYYSCINTSILLTSFVEEKTNLYNTCVTSTFQIKERHILFDSSCSFFSNAKSMFVLDSVIDNNNFDLDNLERFLSVLSIDQKALNSRMKLYKGQSTDLVNTDEEFMLMQLGKDTIILIDQPYILIAKKIN